MAESIAAERAHAPDHEVVAEDARALEPAAGNEALADARAIRLAGLGAGAASEPPPWFGSDRGTVTNVLGTIQRTAGNRAAAALLASVQRSADDAGGAGGGEAK